MGLQGWLLPTAHAADADWSGFVEGKLFYTNDVFQFSAARRLALHEDPTQPTKVELEKPQDIIWEPKVEVARKLSAGRWPTEVLFGSQGFIYTEHPIFNHGTYRLQVKQALAHGTALVLRYRYSPNLFLGPNNEHRSGQRLIEEERVTSHIWRAMLEHRLNQDWALTLVSRFGLRFFNGPFAECDTHFYTLGSEMAYHMSQRFTFLLSYLYERGLADGADQPQFKDDVSYRNHFVSFSSEIKVAEPVILALTYAFQRNNSTSELAGDSNNGRQDETNQGNAELRYALTYHTMLTLGFQQAQRESNRAASGFHDTNYWLGGQHRF